MQIYPFVRMILSRLRVTNESHQHSHSFMSRGLRWSTCARSWNVTLMAPSLTRIQRSPTAKGRCFSENPSRYRIFSMTGNPSTQSIKFWRFLSIWTAYFSLKAFTSASDLNRCCL